MCNMVSYCRLYNAAHCMTYTSRLFKTTNCSVYVKYILISPITKYFKHEFRARFPAKAHDHAPYRRTNTT